jgi:hypothetical protein
MLTLAACSDQSRESPTEPTVQPEAGLTTKCGAVAFPLQNVQVLIKKVFPLGALRLEAIARAGAIKLLWDTCKRAQAQKAAISFIDWMNSKSASLIGTQEQRNNLVTLILNGVGVQVTVPTTSSGDFGVGFFDPASEDPLVVTTASEIALTEIPAHAFTEPTVVTVSRKADNFPLSGFDGDQFPPVWDYDVFRSSGTTSSADHVIQNGTAIVGFCLFPEPPSVNGEFVVDYPPENQRRLGHNPVQGAPGYPFEILEPVDLAEERPGLYASLVANCGNLDPNTATLGGFGLGVSGLANAAWRKISELAQGVFLPQALAAATLGTLPPPISGKAGSLSPIEVVETAEEFGFETGEPEWDGSGFWDRNDFEDVTNQAFGTFVIGGEGDRSGGALPQAFAGNFSAWFGQPTTGNYMGDQLEDDDQNSGGTSVSANSGAFVSPYFRVPDDAGVKLRLKTWWEIESVNPSSFDLMDIVLQKTTGEDIVLRRLNPTTDPPGGAPTLPYTSGGTFEGEGFNTAPLWKDVEISLSDYRGQTVRLRLAFNTGDGNYNGFRGWIVDQVAVQISTGTVLLSRQALRLGTDLIPADRMPFKSRSE